MELTSVQLLVLFIPVECFFSPSLMKESAEPAGLCPPPCRGRPGDAWLRIVQGGPPLSCP